MPSTHVPLTRSINELPVFSEVDHPDFGERFDVLTNDLFACDYQGPLRTSEGGYTEGSVFVYRNAEIKALVAHEALGNQPIEVYSCPYRAHSDFDPPGFHQLMDNNIFTMQPPRHAAGRQLVSRQLTMKSIARFSDQVESMIQGLVEDAIRSGEVDFRREVADRAMTGFWQIALGWTEDVAKEACRLASISQLSNLLDPSPEERRAIDGASLELFELVSRTVARQLDAGTSPLLTDLSADYEQMTEDTPGRPPVLAELFGASLLDGLHSLGGVIASVVHGLLGSPKSLEAVRADRSLVPAAFREGVRLNPAVTFTQRHALSDLMIGDVEVPSGTPVTMAWLFGNRDPEVFAEPNEYRLARQARSQTTFGGGLYICPGRNVVRFLSEIVLKAVTEPSVEIEAIEGARWVPATGLHELETMPVRISSRN